MDKTIKVYGYSKGDRSVGIPPCDFKIDTGMLELNNEEKQSIIDEIIRCIWELHDNGDINFEFSDETEKYKERDMYYRTFSSKDSQKILEEKRK